MTAIIDRLGVRSTTVRGILIGLCLWSPFVLVLAWYAGPELWVRWFPVLTVVPGDGRYHPAPFDRVLPGPHRVGSRVCWTMGFTKHYDYRPQSLNFYVRTDVTGEVPIKVDRIDEQTGQQHYAIIAHSSGESWTNQYCTELPREMVGQWTIVGARFVYRSPGDVWRLVQAIPEVIIPARAGAP